MGEREWSAPRDRESRGLPTPFLLGRILRWRAHWVVGVVALRPLRPRRAGGSSHHDPSANQACAPLCAVRRLAARAVPPRFTAAKRIAGFPGDGAIGLPTTRQSRFGRPKRITTRPSPGFLLSRFESSFH